MKEMDTKTLQDLIASGEKVNLIDIREPYELETGKIPGVVNIPLGDIEFNRHNLNKDTPYILVCRSGRRTAYATEMLSEQGYDVTNLVGGMLEWQGEIE